MTGMTASDQDDDGERPRSLSAGRGRPRRAREPKLEELFGDPLPDREAAMWALLDEAERRKALQRARALVKWKDGDAGISAKQAAVDAGVKLVRFYQMNAKWREQRSLAVLGVGASPERERRSMFKAPVNQVLQSAVADLVRDENASVRSLALRLADEALSRGVPPEDLPGHNTLRSIVERARRDRQRRREVGNALLLDHAACALQRPDGAPWTVFVIVDAASHLILGAAPGEVGSAFAAYAEAAADAITRVTQPAFQRVPWADRLTGVQVVPGGEGADAFADVSARAAAIGVGLNITGDRKAGRYLEQVVGRAIGVLRVWPARTAAPSLPEWAAERAPRLDRDKAGARIKLAVEDHNSRLITHGDFEGERAPPLELIHLLEAIAAS
jgi:hypothetical protein